MRDVVRAQRPDVSKRAQKPNWQPVVKTRIGRREEKRKGKNTQNYEAVEADEEIGFGEGCDVVVEERSGCQMAGLTSLNEATQQERVQCDEAWKVVDDPNVQGRD